MDILGDDPPAISCLHQPAICLNVSLMPRKHRFAEISGIVTTGDDPQSFSGIDIEEIDRCQI